MFKDKLNKAFTTFLVSLAIIYTKVKNWLVNIVKKVVTYILNLKLIKLVVSIAAIAIFVAIFLKCERKELDAVTTMEVVKEIELDSITQMLTAELEVLREEGNLSNKKLRQIKQQLKDVSKVNNILVRQRKTLQSELDNTERKTVKTVYIDRFNTVLKTDTFTNTIYTVPQGITFAMDNYVDSLRSYKDKYRFLQRLLDRQVTVFDTTDYENNTVLISSYTTQGVPIKNYTHKLEFTKFVAVSIPNNSLYLNVGLTVPNLNSGSIYIPLGLTYNKDKFSYSLGVFMQDFVTPIGGEVKVGIRLHKW
jgi:hypothetical protein